SQEHAPGIKRAEGEVHGKPADHSPPTADRGNGSRFRAPAWLGSCHGDSPSYERVRVCDWGTSLARCSREAKPFHTSCLLRTGRRNHVVRSPFRCRACSESSGGRVFPPPFHFLARRAEAENGTG